jgi:hypothetical protein
MEETMKCIKTKDGEIKRVQDKEAEVLCRSGEATFIPKSLWKKDNPEHEARAKAEKARKERQAAEAAK